MAIGQCGIHAIRVQKACKSRVHVKSVTHTRANAYNERNRRILFDTGDLNIKDFALPRGAWWIKYGACLPFQNGD